MSSSSDSRQVNNLLHTLRGEQFRHLQNQRQSRTHLQPRSNNNVPTLPLGFLSVDYDHQTESTNSKEPGTSPSSTCSGPTPPKSWRLTKQTEDGRDTAAWRTNALSLTARRVDDFANNSKVPPLSLLCLRVLVIKCTDAEELQEDIIPHILPHLRRDLIRSCAISSPLPRWKLQILYHPEGHVEGEVIIVGPKAYLKDEEFLRSGLQSYPPTHEKHAEAETDDWETEGVSSRPLHNIVVVSTRMSTSTFLTLPPSLTSLTLVDLGGPLPLHRLPRLCPLLEFLDLSYNKWLQSPSLETSKSLARIEWARWSQLKVLGWRECFIPANMNEALNKGRWDDVELIQK